MTVEQSGIDVEVTLRIQGGKDLSRSIHFFKWSSFMNNGYAIHARIVDPNLGTFQELENEKYLKDARKIPLEIQFKMKYLGGGNEDDGGETETRIAYITNLSSKIPPGSQAAGFFEFIAIDPPTWFLNRGDADGSVYTGNVSSVIKQIIAKYAPGIAIDIADTDDSKINKWHQMRQDPKTFIMTLIDWSSSVTKRDTNWVIASVDKKIIIREQSELKSTDLGEYSVNDAYPGSSNVINWERMDDNYLTNIQTSLTTGGISAVSGLYCDSQNSITEETTVVDDRRTPNKKNVNIVQEQGFERPTNLDTGRTFVRAVPEDSSGAVGIRYQDYIDGRARALFLGNLDSLQRLKLVVNGLSKLDDSSQLGASTVFLRWTDANGDPYIHQGKWLVYGFEHVLTPQKHWKTSLYLNRKDFNAAAQKV